MKISRKEINILIGLLGVLVAVVVYFFVYSDFNDKTAALQAESASLQPQAETYEAVNARLDEYELGLVSNQNEVNSIFDHYPANIRLDDASMLWVNFDKAYPEDIQFSDLAFDEIAVAGMADVVDTGDAELTDNGDGTYSYSQEDAEEITANYALYTLPTSMTFGCSRDGVAKIFSYLKSQHNRLSVSAISIEYDEEYGCIAGQIFVNQYYLEGTGKEYSPVFVPTVPTGQTDLFHIGDYSMPEFVHHAKDEDEEKIERDPYGNIDYSVDDVDDEADDDEEEEEE